MPWLSLGSHHPMIQVLIKTIKKFPNVIGYQQPDFNTHEKITRLWLADYLYELDSIHSVLLPITKYRSLGHVLHCDKTRRAFENTREMYKTRTASVFYLCRNVWNVRRVLSQCNTQLRLHLLYDIEVMWRKTIKLAFSMFYTLIKHGLLTNQRAQKGLFILSTGL